MNLIHETIQRNKEVEEDLGESRFRLLLQPMEEISIRVFEDYCFANSENVDLEEAANRIGMSSLQFRQQSKKCLWSQTRATRKIRNAIRVAKGLKPEPQVLDELSWQRFRFVKLLDDKAWIRMYQTKIVPEPEYITLPPPPPISEEDWEWLNSLD